MAKRIISLDLDGTILTEVHKIDTNLVQLLKKYADRGDIILFNTGRTLAYSRFVFETINFPFYGAFTNGVALAHFPEGEIIYEISLPGGLMDKIYNLFLKHKIDPVFQGGLRNNDKTFNEELKYPNKDLLDVFSVDKDRRVQVKSLLKYYSEDFVSVFGCSGNGQESMSLAEELNAIKGLYSVAFLHSYNMTSYWITAGSESVNKGIPVKKLAELYGVKPENIYSFGNDRNDLPMLLAAGHPVTIEGSPEELIKVSESVVAIPENHGVFNYLKGMDSRA
ncbi:MAG: HAD family phosphatase [Spirochaetales bacterium]|nr:HAD family phosphatase [Spirochaetales bacterium]